jgi:hypothetical protein
LIMTMFPFHKDLNAERMKTRIGGPPFYSVSSTLAQPSVLKHTCLPR